MKQKNKKNQEFSSTKKKNSFEDIVKNHPINHESGNLKKNFSDFKTDIPNQSSLPPKILVKPIEKITSQNINAEMLESAKNNLKKSL